MRILDYIKSSAVAGAVLLATGEFADAGWPFLRLNSDCAENADCAFSAAGDGCARTERMIVVVRNQDCDEESHARESKLKRMCRCLCPPEPPRGEAAIALPARVRNEFAAVKDEPESERESAAADRVDQLEEDLTRLTLIVEEIVKTQKKDGEDLTRLTLAVEQVADAQKKGQEDLTRISVILDNLAKEVKK
jgi:hypothetical protein